MSHLHFSPLARRDLYTLFDYIVKDNPVAAKGLLGELKETCRRIARFPEIGVQREDLAPDLRGFPVRNYIIFYRHRQEGVEIVRVLHSARDHLGMVE